MRKLALLIAIGTFLVCDVVRAQTSNTGQDDAVDSELTFYGEPGYLMSNEQILNEIVGEYEWVRAKGELGLYVTNNGTLYIVNGLVTAVYPQLNTSNINGTIPVKSKYERGIWYRQENTRNNMTMYYLVAYENSTEVLVYRNAMYSGNKIYSSPKKSKYVGVTLMRDQEGRWGYSGNNGQFELLKRKTK